MFRFILILVINLHNCVHSQYSRNSPLEIYDICSTENDVCTTVESCPHLHEYIRKGYHPQICSYIGKTPIICCIKNIENRWHLEEKTISFQYCEKYRDQICPPNNHFIQGGDLAQAKELPFMALIGYGPRQNKEWKCGGSLISKRFILSAAHCSSDNNKPRWALLGDLDISTNIEDAKPTEYKITRIYNHEKYKSPFGYNDIALYKLNSNVMFNDYIRPICLNQLDSLNIESTTVVGAGWGQKSFAESKSKQLLKVDLKLFDIKGCYRDKYQGILPNGINETTMLCAGSEEGGKDTCLGDSGGPLFIKPNQELLARQCFLYTQIGIISFGYQCGVKNYPAIYTNVKSFLYWIESIVWPSNVTDSSLIWQK